MQQNISLKPYNSFQVEAFTTHFLKISDLNDLSNLSSLEPIFILGSGCNTLFTKDWNGLVLKNNLLGLETVFDTKDSTTIKIGSGYDWHNLVTWSVQKNLSGIENLALIPGTVGAAAFGNIAAYGQSFEQTFVSLEAYELTTGKLITFAKSDCQMGYRESIFKHSLKSKYFITSVTLQLSKTPTYATDYHSNYESLMPEIAKARNERLKQASQAGSQPEQSEELEGNEKRRESTHFEILDVYNAIINIRTQKLPDWTKIGTAGSVFKNPFVSKEQYLSLCKSVPNLQWYPTTGMSYPSSSSTPSDTVKIPAGRLLDHLGWRGKTIGQVSTHPTQALVVVNLGNATGIEIYNYCELMRQDIRANFGIELEYEIQVI